MLKKLLIFFLVMFFCCSCKHHNIEEISFSSWGSITEVKILQQVISDFEKDNPNIKVKFIHIPQNYFQKLHLLFVAGQEPDVLFINNLYLPLYADYLMEINIDKNKFYSQSYEALSYQGRTYAIPRDISNLVFYYNKELFLPPQKWTIENLLTSLDSSKGNYKISFERDMYWAEPYLLTLGYDEGLKFYKNLEGKYAPTPSQVGSSTLAQMFIEGKLALYLSGRWMYPKIKESATFNWGMLTFPGTTFTDASGWAISKKTKHREAAIKFVDYLSSEESINYFAQTGLIIPARINSINKVENKRVFAEAIQKSIPHVVDKNYKKNLDRANKELFN